MNDNLARVLPQEYEDYARINRERAQRKAKQMRMSRLTTLVSACLVIALAFTVISRFMQINELEKQISANTTELNSIRSTNEQKEVLIESGMSLDQIAYEAQTRLGMNKPANNQIVYLSIKNVDCCYVSPN